MVYSTLRKVDLTSTDEIQLVSARIYSEIKFYFNLPPPLLIMFRRYQVLSNFIRVLIFIDVEILVLFLFSSGSVGLEINREQRIVVIASSARGGRSNPSLIK